MGAGEQALRSLGRYSRSDKLEVTTKGPPQTPQPLSTCHGQQGTALKAGPAAVVVVGSRDSPGSLNRSREPGMKYVSGAHLRTSEHLRRLQPEAFPGSTRELAVPWLGRGSARCQVEHLSSCCVKAAQGSLTADPSSRKALPGCSWNRGPCIPGLAEGTMAELGVAERV